MLHFPSLKSRAHERHAPDAEVWKAGSPTSEIRFRLRHLVVTEIAGRATRWQAELYLDFERPNRSWVDVVIDAASFDTATAERDDHIRSAEFLDVAVFPAIHFRSRRVRVEGPGRYQIAGDLTIRDVTREVTLAAETTPAGSAIALESKMTFTARTRINRQDFGLHWNQDLDAGGVIVGDMVDVQISLEAHKAR